MFKKIAEFSKQNKAFYGAVAMIIVALIAVYVESCFGIHPVTEAIPQYHKLWVLFLIGVFLGLAGLVLLAVVLFVNVKAKKPSFTVVTSVLISVLAFTYMFVMPPMSSADDIRHYLAAYKLSNQMMFKEAVDENNHVYMRAEDVNILLNDFPGNDDYYKLVTNMGGSVDNTPVAFTLDEPVECLWIAYFPSALGITIARIFGMRQIPLMLMGRLFSIIFFMVFYVLTMRKLPFGREVFFFICALPMTLNQIASCSYDVLVLAFSFYFTAYVLQLAFMADRVRVRDMVILTAVMTIMAPVKTVYIFLALLMFMIPRAKFGSAKKYVISALSMAFVVGGFFLALKLVKIDEYVSQTDPYLDYAGTTVYPMSFILGNPMTVFKIFVNTLAVYAGSWFDDMLGLRLGWQDVTLPRILIVFVAILGCFTAVKSAGEPTYFKPGQRTVAIAAAVCCSLMTMAALFLVYTPEGAQFIYGVQGRYFLPVLPLFMLGIRTDAIRRRDGSERWIVFGAAVINYWAIGCIIAEVMSRSGVMKMLGAS